MIIFHTFFPVPSRLLYHNVSYRQRNFGFTRKPAVSHLLSSVNTFQLLVPPLSHFFAICRHTEMFSVDIPEQQMKRHLLLPFLVSAVYCGTCRNKVSTLSAKFFFESMYTPFHLVELLRSERISGENHKILEKTVNNELKKLNTVFVLTNYTSMVPKAISCSRTTIAIQIVQLLLIINQY